VKAVLFDLDGILLMGTTNPGQTEAMLRAVYQCGGRRLTDEEVASVPRHGRTDVGVLNDFAALAGCDPPFGVLSRLYCEGAALALPYTVQHPNARAVLNYVRNAGLPCRLATGNLRVMASRKLRHAGLVDCLDLANSGFGDAAEDRVAVLESALGDLQASEVCYLCDTPQDYEAAAALGMDAFVSPSAEVEPIECAELPGLAEFWEAL
jgi:beta-phosphoglucomutase-like phosphatase (HAD superfamily)